MSQVRQQYQLQGHHFVSVCAVGRCIHVLTILCMCESTLVSRHTNNRPLLMNVRFCCLMTLGLPLDLVHCVIHMYVRSLLILLGCHVCVKNSTTTDPRLDWCGIVPRLDKGEPCLSGVADILVDNVAGTKLLVGY